MMSTHRSRSPSGHVGNKQPENEDSSGMPSQEIVSEPEKPQSELGVFSTLNMMY